MHKTVKVREVEFITDRQRLRQILDNAGYDFGLEDIGAAIPQDLLRHVLDNISQHGQSIHGFGSEVIIVPKEDVMDGRFGVPVHSDLITKSGKGFLLDIGKKWPCISLSIFDLNDVTGKGGAG